MECPRGPLERIVGRRHREDPCGFHSDTARATRILADMTLCPKIDDMEQRNERLGKRARNVLLIQLPRGGKICNALRGGRRTTFSNLFRRISVVLEADANDLCSFVALD
jgi:hypothetical protein